MTDPEHLIIAISAAMAGAKEILSVYAEDFGVEYKQDHSPLTLADQKAHAAISRILDRTGLPVLSEEGKNIPYAQRRYWDTFWLIDPLDGTKEFVKRNGEFTVNIALISKGRPILGVILVPVTGVLYFASTSTGARKTTANLDHEAEIPALIRRAVSLPLSAPPEKLTMVCSRSHLSQETLDFIDTFKKDGQEIDYVSVGSSIKMCLVAEGKAHIYPRFGPTMEWDTAAGQAIVESAGGMVIRQDNLSPVAYNKENLLNPWFIAYFSTSSNSISNTRVE